MATKIVRRYNVEMGMWEVGVWVNNTQFLILRYEQDLVNV